MYNNEQAPSTDLNTQEEALEMRRHFNQLETARRIYENTWDEVTTYVLPSEGTMVYQTQYSSPERRTTKRLDSTATKALQQLVAKVNAEMTGNSTRWFDWREKNPEIDARQEVRTCLQGFSNMGYDNLNGGSFRTANVEFLQNWIGYGTAYVERTIVNKEPRWKSIPIREMYIAENEKNEVDYFYRKFKLTYRQAEKFFSESVLPDQIREKGEKDPFCEVEFLHRVCPNEDYDPKKKKNTYFQFKSTYLCMETNDIIRTGFFKQAPYVCSRFWKRSGEVYGGSCAIDALADIRVLNAMQASYMRLIQRKADPPLGVPHDAVIMPLRITPNSVNIGAVTADGKLLVQELYGKQDSDQTLLEAMEQKRQSIRSHFFVDPLINRSQSIRTAAEVGERKDEEMVGITPFLARLETEYLIPVTDYVLEWLLDTNTTIQIPPILHNRTPDIHFSAPLAKTQRGQELQNLVQLFQMIQNLAQVDPTVTQHVDMNEGLNELVDLLSVNMKIIKPAAVVAALQQQQQQQAQQQQQMANAQQAVQTATGGLSNMAKAGLVGRSDVGLPPLDQGGPSSIGVG